MTDASGAIVWAADYKPFGEATITVSTITNNLRFPGQYYDAETGLHYNYYRDYNPAIGKYAQADPVGLIGGINLYAYVGNSPTNWIDQLGLWLTKDHSKIIRRYVDQAFPALDPMQRMAIRRAIEDGSKFADTFQDSQYAYMHHMRNGSIGQPRSDAEALMNKYINQHLQKSNCAVGRGNYYDAYKELGMALHPIMDSTSPAHGDFLPWFQSYPALFGLMHLWSEPTIQPFQIQETVDIMLKIYH